MSTEQKVRNRWIVVIGAILIQLALGTIYSWGTITIFVSPYLNEIREVTVYIFGVGLLSFAVTMIFAFLLTERSFLISKRLISIVEMVEMRIFKFLR